MTGPVFTGGDQVTASVSLVPGFAATRGAAGLPGGSFSSVKAMTTVARAAARSGSSATTVTS